MARRRGENETILQTFEWHTTVSPERSHYSLLRDKLPLFAQIGITGIWLPPGCKANNPHGNGYDIYDLWDLGEFDQKGSRATKWGGRQELVELIAEANELQIDVIWDAVLNHKQAGDQTETEVWAVEVDSTDRRFEICPPKKIEAWLLYDFPGRAAEGMKYSTMTWRAEHFNGTDWDQSGKQNAIYKLIDDPSLHPAYQQPTRPSATDSIAMRSRLQKLRRQISSQTAKRQLQLQPPTRRPGKGWAEDVDDEHGNNDYLLFSNIDHIHPEVRQDMLNWAQWMVHDIGVQGFRLDAAQHFSYNFTKDWILHADKAAVEKYKEHAFIIGEIWTGDVSRILKWLHAVQSHSSRRLFAYDAPLLYNFSRISEDVRQRSNNIDLRTIVHQSLVLQRPQSAVTLVTNHDTQPGQTCATPMHTALKSLFYAFILLRQDGLPCVFWGDLFGTEGPHAEPPACLVNNRISESGRRCILPDLILCRKLFAYGEQKDYWDSATCIGWTRAGKDGENGLAVVVNVGAAIRSTMMRIGQAGDVYIDLLGQIREDIAINSEGQGRFPCRGENLSIFVKKLGENTKLFPVEFDMVASPDR